MLLAATGTIVTVFGIKHGVGKTTIATNLAVALASETSSSVALADLDLPFGSTLDSSVLNDPERLQNSILKAPRLHIVAVPLIPGRPSAADGGRAIRLLTNLSARYQFVIVEAPVGLTKVTVAALELSELALLVTTPEIAALRRTRACLRLLQELKFSASKLQLVLNRVDPETRVNSSELVAALEHPVAWRVASDVAAMRVASGQPVLLVQPEAQISRDIREIAQQFGDVQPPLKREGPGGAACGAKPPRRPILPSDHAEAIPPKQGGRSPLVWTAS